MPRFAQGSTDVVAGYRAALKGQDHLRFYGGGQLGRDLSLPRLRELWPTPSLEAAGEASAEWQAAFRGQRTGVAGREALKLSRTAPEVAQRNLAAYTERLTQVPATDRIAWSIAAREVSGALSAWSQVDQTNAAALRQAAAVISRTAQDRRPAAGPGQDYHREVQNTREAQAVDIQLRHLARLQLVSAAPEAAHPDGRKLAQLPKQNARQRSTQQGPALELPRPIEPRPQTPVRYGQERQDRDAGR